MDVTPDVACIGETMAMVAPSPPVPLATATSLTLSHGGAESNVAAWLASLGCAAHWCGRVGADPLGQRILRDLGAAGVGTSSAVIDTRAPTAVYFKDPGPEATTVWYYRSGSAGSRLDSTDVERALSLRPRLVHLSGITPALSDSCAQAVGHAVRLARELGITVSFDVNYRPALWPDAGTAAARLHALAVQADLVFVGLDEAAMLWNASTDADVRRLLPEPPALIVKDGPRQASEFLRDQLTRVPALAVEVAEPVGAGDAFAAGWLRGWLLGRPPVQCLRLGHLVAARALSSATDLAPLTGQHGGLEELAATGRPWRESGTGISATGRTGSSSARDRPA
jgi:2-dehydro-3-deoxygluconokinase